MRIGGAAGQPPLAQGVRATGGRAPDPTWPTKASPTESFRKDFSRKAGQNPSGRIPSGRAVKILPEGFLPEGLSALFSWGACLFLGGGVPFFLWARAFFWCVVAFFFAQILPEGFPGGVGIPLPAEGNGPQKILPEGFCGPLAHSSLGGCGGARGGRSHPAHAVASPSSLGDVRPARVATRMGFCRGIPLWRNSSQGGLPFGRPCPPLWPLLSSSSGEDNLPGTGATSGVNPRDL